MSQAEKYDQKPEIKGMGTALITPFRRDGSIDYDKVRALTEFQISSGADFIVATGTTGETPALTAEEQERIIQTIIEVNQGRIPLVVGIGGNGTCHVIERLKHLDTKGIDAILSVTPYYNKPSQEGLYQHFKAIASHSPLPVILYNVPARTAVNMLPVTTLRLANDCPNIIGIKEASGIVSQIDMIVKQRPKDFIVLSGDDTITYPLMAMGADGVISVIGNAFPKEFSTMCRFVREGKIDQALPIHHMFKELYPLLFVEGNPSGIKCTMKMRALIEEELRLPLVPVGEETRSRIKSVVQQICEVEIPKLHL